MQPKIITIAMLLCLSSIDLLAQTTNKGYTGRITRIQGEVYVLNYPDEHPTGPGPHYHYNKTYYTINKAKIGDTISATNILRTGPKGRVRLVYNHGDLLHVGGDSYLKFDVVGENMKRRLIVSLEQGFMRAIVRRGNGLSKTAFKSGDYFAYVVGAEFYIETRGNAHFDLSVLRGRVGFVAGNKKQKKPSVAIEKGDRIIYRNGKEVYDNSLTRGWILHIQTKTHVQHSGLKTPSFNMQSRLVELDGEAYDNILHDLKDSSPDIYEEFTSSKHRLKNLDGLLAYTIEAVATEAPAKIGQVEEPEAPDDAKPLNPYYKVDD